jgi:hypothetical protein
MNNVINATPRNLINENMIVFDEKYAMNGLPSIPIPPKQ